MNKQEFLQRQFMLPLCSAWTPPWETVVEEMPIFDGHLAAPSQPVRTKRTREAFQPPPAVWTDEEVVLMVDHYLVSHLKALRDRRSSEATLKAIYAWLVAPLMRRPYPFTFQACCIMVGVDAESYRTHYLYELCSNEPGIAEILKIDRKAVLEDYQVEMANQCRFFLPLLH